MTTTSGIAYHTECQTSRSPRIRQTVKDGEDIDSSIRHTIDQSVIALQNLLQILTTKFRNHFPGEREFP